MSKHKHITDNPMLGALMSIAMPQMEQDDNLVRLLEAANKHGRNTERDLIISFLEKQIKALDSNVGTLKNQVLDTIAIYHEIIMHLKTGIYRAH